VSLDYKYCMVITVEGNHYHFGAEDMEDCKEQFFKQHGDENIYIIYQNVFEALAQEEE